MTILSIWVLVLVHSKCGPDLQNVPFQIFWKCSYATTDHGSMTAFLHSQGPLKMHWESFTERIAQGLKISGSPLWLPTCCKEGVFAEFINFLRLITNSIISELRMEGTPDCHCPCGANDVQQKGATIDATHTNLWVVPRGYFPSANSINEKQEGLLCLPSRWDFICVVEGFLHFGCCLWASRSHQTFDFLVENP